MKLARAALILGADDFQVRDTASREQLRRLGTNM
jgi:hypothetical protein